MAFVAESLVKYNGPATGMSTFAKYLGKLGTVKASRTVAGIELVDVKFVNEVNLRTTQASKLIAA